MIERRLRDRYSRQTMFPGIGEDGQAKLISGTAIIIGCGALGCNIATLLVRAGMGRIRIIDRDFIEYHNLQRQVLFDEEDIRAGLPKAIAAERHLTNVNSSVEIKGIVADVNYTNIERFCSGANVILDGLDNIETRLLINDVSLKHKIPWVYGGAIASSGMTMTIIPGETPCFRCFSAVVPEPGTMPTCETAGVVNTAPALIGSLQATEAMKILVGSEEINRELINVDVWRVTFHKLKIEYRKDCPACQGKYEFLENRYVTKTTSLCGQSRAVQVVNTKVSEIALDELAARLQNVGHITQNEFMLSFTADDHEIVVFRDGRAIIKNTIDESLAKELYNKYIGNLS
ncbi:MAG TPA: thiazole biosynthesis adenylyltransferase ThiF [Dehalococcoidia bacterium]|nr:thiazole biosynthesis adenylyltransferase ThiF [Dehalococcoidia bacterium]